jgi:predicted DCC family thiol-disulfide oxidoreductase YuxK
MGGHGYAADEMTAKNMTQKPVIFFDGVCGLCNRSVDFLIRHDKRRLFLFAPLQGETAAKELSGSFTEQPDTIILKEDLQVYYKSTAVLRILSKIGGVWKLTAAGYIIPRYLRDIIYDIVANNRYKIFGKKESCRIPSPEERKIFLD